MRIFLLILEGLKLFGLMLLFAFIITIGFAVTSILIYISILEELYIEFNKKLSR